MDGAPQGHNGTADEHRPRVIVSCDPPIGPRLKQDLRPYCPAQHLDRFDDFVRYVESTDSLRTSQEANLRALMRTEGHYDPHQRMRDLDHDGTAAEVIFHGSQNGEPIPFVVSDPSIGVATMGRVYDVDYELAGVGRHIYNQWLADFCSVEPERHVGLAHLPMWDIDAAVKELEWARAAGLKGVNFPAEAGPTETSRSRWGGVNYYHDPVWEPFWSACEDNQMPLATHGGAGTPTAFPGGNPIWVLEAQELSRRPMHRLILSAVFERHPGLKMVLTEQPGDWWRTRLADMDSIHMTVGRHENLLPKLPSEYAAANCFIGASFQSRFEAEDAVVHGYAGNILWGTDYPHVEGTWKYPEDPEAEPVSIISARYTYHDLPAEDVVGMLGLNAVQVYGLDVEALAKVAERINAPTLAHINKPVDEIPADHGMWAFRQLGAFA